MSSIADQAAQKPLITQLDHGEQTLAFYAWPQPPQNPRAAVLLLHGLGEHMGRYGHVASALQAAGYVVFGYDHHGHGLSSGLRGNLLSPSQLVDDVHFVIGHVRTLTPAPLVVLGHSMGGLIAARAVAQSLPHIDALVMSSPALGAQTNWIQKFLLATLPKLLPHVRVEKRCEIGLACTRRPGGSRLLRRPLGTSTNFCRIGCLDTERRRSNRGPSQHVVHADLADVCGSRSVGTAASECRVCTLSALTGAAVALFQCDVPRDL